MPTSELAEALLFDAPAFAKWYGNIKEALLKKQLSEGQWKHANGAEYATAKACIVLLSQGSR